MKTFKQFIDYSRKQILNTISILVGIIGIASIYYVIEINIVSNDECLWVTNSKTGKIYFQNVKIGGVTHEAGIRDGDIFLAINSIKLKSAMEAQTILNRMPKGEYAIYTVGRNEEIFETKVRIKKLVMFSDLADGLFTFFWFLFGFIVISAKPDGKVQGLFYKIGVAFVLNFAVTRILSALLYKPIDTYFISVATLSLILSSFIPIFILHFFWMFPRKFSFIEKKWFLRILYTIPFLLIFFVMFETTTAGIKYASQFWRTNSAFVLAYFARITFLIGLISLFINYLRVKDKEEKKPLLIILIGYFLGVLSMVYIQFIAPNVADTVFNSPEMYMPILLTVLIPISFGISIFKYQLMDVSIVVKNTLLYGAATLTLALIYFLSVYGIGQSLSSAIGTDYKSIIAAISFVIFAFIFQSTKDKFQDLITRKFYPEHFAYQRILIDFNKELTNIVGLGNILDSIRDKFVNALKIKEFGLMLKNKSGELVLVRSIGIREKDFKVEIPPLKDFVQKRFREGDCLCIEQHNYKDAFPAGYQYLIDENIFTVIPLVVKSNIVGLLLFGLKYSGSQFGGKDIDLLFAVANQAAVSIENARLYEAEAEKLKMDKELELARKIQQNLLPKVPPVIDGLEIFGRMIPAMHVGGDYYDIIPVSEKKVYLIVGDVSGKGLSAAFYMTKLQTILRLYCYCEKPLKEIMSDLNKTIYDALERSWFISLSLVFIDMEKKVLHYCRAGHVPLLYFDGEKIISKQISGMALGLDNHQLFEQSLEIDQISLRGGEIFFLYSDGITETFNINNEVFGEERLKGLLFENRTKRPEEIFNNLLNGVDDFKREIPYNDDITGLIIKVK